METKRCKIKDLSCGNEHYNEYEVAQFKETYKNGSPIPLPFINKQNQVIAFYNSFFALKELKVASIGVISVD